MKSIKESFKVQRQEVMYLRNKLRQAIHFRSGDAVHPAGVAAAAGDTGPPAAVLRVAGHGAAEGNTLHGGCGVARAGQESFHTHPQLGESRGCGYLKWTKSSCSGSSSESL